MEKLEADYTDGEIHFALMAMNPLKASCPHELHAMFYQTSWDIVRPSVTKYVKKAMEGEERMGLVSKVMVVRILKMENPTLIT